ncbi:hypothetical protein niasHT_029904 [Heterodera trifolii]|uniref:Rho-GAP domain-containing protein n=1 Tax=Heterodera trifolii TaxID=157864 RepID=A0ABD2KBP5_9BILA
MASADQKNTSSATASSAAFASDPRKMGAETIAKPTAPPQKMNTHFLNSSTTPQQTHHRNNSKQPTAQQQQPQTARRNSAARRHTTPDMAASAAYGMVLCGSDEMEQRYRGRIEKVKFGVPVNEAFCPDIPATLLVLLLKVNKEGPLKKDIWRAPGNQAQVRKLSHIMQHGRLVNISNISVYTAASVIKRFLAKLPGGIFGVENERQLFEVAEQHSRAVGTHDDQQTIDLFCRIVTGLPVPSQHLLALLFGTFRVITDSAQTFGTRMTPDAIGISVAPSLFHTCIHDGQRAKLEDIMRFKLASQVISKIIQSFGAVRLFPFECYEFYARITGKTLRRDENHWHISFHLPSRTLSQPSIRFERPASPGGHEPQSELEQQQQFPTTSKQQPYDEAGSRAEHSQNAVHGTGGHDDATAPPSLSLDEFCEDEDVYGESLPELPRHPHMPTSLTQLQQQHQHPHYRRREQSRSLEESKIEWKYRASAGGARRRREEGLSTSMGEVIVHSEEEEGPDYFLHSSAYLLESTRSLTYLEWVHERQTRRMKTRSEWFLSPPSSVSPCSTTAAMPCGGGGGCAKKQQSSGTGGGGGRKGAHYAAGGGTGCGGGDCCSRSAELLLPRMRQDDASTGHEHQIGHHRCHPGEQQPQCQCHHCSSHHQQRQQQQLLPGQTVAKEDEPMMVVSSSGEEEMCCCGCCCMSADAVGCCSRAGCAEPSTDTSMKCSPQRPGSSVLSCCTTSGSMGCADAQMKSQTTTEDSSLDGDHDGVEEGDDDAFLATTAALTGAEEQCSSPAKLVRQPFQLLQERQYSTSSTTEGSGPSTQVTPSATAGPNEACKSGGAGGGRQRFFGSGEQEGGLQALPELVETMASSTSPQARRYSAPFVSGDGDGVGAASLTLTQQAAAAAPHQLQQQRSVEQPATTASAACSSRSVIAASMSSGSSSGGGSSSSSGNSTQTVIASATTSASAVIVAGGGQMPSSAAADEVATAPTSQQQQPQLLQGARGGGSSGVARRRSWRVHYTRPKNKSFDYETITAGHAAYEESVPSSHSTPLCQSPPGSLLFSRRRNSNGGGAVGGLDIAAGGTSPAAVSSSAAGGAVAAKSSTTALVRRRSSNNGGGVKSKKPVQTRRSTQI